MTTGVPADTFHLLRPRNVLLFLCAFSLPAAWRLDNPALWIFGWGAMALCLAAAAEAALMVRAIRGARLHAERSFQHETVPVELHLRNAARFGPFLLEVRDTFPPGVAHSIRTLWCGPWDSRHAAALEYESECHHHRGLYVLGPVRLRATDCLDLFERAPLLPVFTTLLVYPQAAELRGFGLLGEGTRRHVGMETVRHRGRSEEFIGLRDYRHGDPPRRIHWPTSAHHGHLLVKDFQDERTTEVSILVDLSRLGLGGLGDQTTAEYAVQAAGSVARHAFETGHAFQLFAIAKAIEHVPLGGGLQHLLTVLDRLVFLKADGERCFADEVAALRTACRPGSTVVLIFSVTTLAMDTLAPLLEDLAENRVRVLIILVDDRTFPKLFHEQERSHVAAAGIEEAVLRLRLLGARVHVLERHPAPAEAIRKGLGVESFAGSA